MLHYIAACPYCLLSVIAIDVEARQLIFNPGCADNEPCNHLACFQVCVCVHRYEGEKIVADFGASFAWIWERGFGLRESVAASGPKKNFQVLYQMLFLERNFRPASDHEYVWLSAEAREREFPGSGEFEVPGPGELIGTMDAFAIFGSNPNQIIREIHAGFRANFSFLDN